MNSNEQQLDKPVSVGDWILTLIIFCIPIVGLIMMLVWAFGGTPSISKRNYCRACLVFMIIGAVIGLVFLALGGLAMLSAGMGAR